MKVVSFSVLVVAFFYTVLIGIGKLQEKEMTYISSTTMEEPIIYPTVTMCFLMDMDFNNGMDWVDPENYKFLFPFEDFGMVEDMFEVQ